MAGKWLLSLAGNSTWLWRNYGILYSRILAVLEAACLQRSSRYAAVVAMMCACPGIISLLPEADMTQWCRNSFAPAAPEGG